MNFMANKLSALLLIAVLLTPVMSFGQEKDAEAQGSDQNGTFVTSLAPTPIFVPGNPDCADLNADDTTFPQITGDWELKLDFASPNGSFPFTNGSGRVLIGPPNANLFLMVASSGSTMSAWSIGPAAQIDRGISAVIVKGGPNANVYSYTTLSSGDTGPFTTPAGQEISHLTFCFEQVIGPSAATVSVSGRVIADGQSVPLARVNIVDEHGQTRSVVTNSFGYYRFDEVEVGQTYIISVFSKGHRFTSRLISINDELTDLDFVADEQGSSSW